MTQCDDKIKIIADFDYLFQFIQTKGAKFEKGNNYLIRMAAEVNLQRI